MEKTIFSIDFDIIMHPSVELYNNMPGEWEERIKRFPMLGNCLVDYNLYRKLTNLFIYLLNEIDKEKIYFITNHEEIVSYLNKKESYHIINIDHHHDWYYNPEDEEKIEKLNCGNWVKYINDNFDLKKYSWIKDYNSMFCDDILNNQKIEYFDIEEIELENFYIPDYFFICLSPPWIPPYIKPLYDIWNDLYLKENKYV